MAQCLVCKSTEVDLWTSVRDEEYQTLELATFRYFLCAKCSVISIFPTLEDHLGEIYTPNYYSFNSDGYNLLFKIKFYLDSRNFQKLHKYFNSRDLQMLDIGGGIGKLSSLVINALPDFRFNSTIVDLDEDAGKIANLEGHQYVKAAFKNAHFDRKFDLILAYNILEHVEDPVAFLDKISSSLNVGGICLIQTPNFDSLDAKLFRSRYWGGLHAPRHFVLFNEESLVESVEKASLRILRHTRIPGGPFWSYSIIGTLNSLRKRDPKKPLYKAHGYTILTGIFTAFDFARRPLMRTSQQLIVCQKSD
jgi:2-polyprenyl-3-methyl-5-hydroxy-6-metoxy-1,4-benzoquinol methylase